MPDTGTVPETVATPLKNGAGSTPAPATPPTTLQDNGDAAKVAQLTKEQIEMRANQIANQKIEEARKQLEDEAERKRLEANEDYKAIATKAETELAEMRKTAAAIEEQKAVDQATSDVFSEFDPKVIEVAKVAGLKAGASTEEAKTELKTKLEAIRTQLGVSKPKVQGNNPAPASPDSFDPVRAGKLMRVDDRNLREPAVRDAIGRHPQVAAFRDFGKRANAVEPQSS